MIYFDTINLQLFAEAGNLVNATSNYVNAYTGEETAFEGANTLSPTMKTYYDTELLENAKPDMIFAQLAMKQDLPRNRGKTVEWRKWNTLPNADELKEGVIPTGRIMGQTYLTGTISQYGTYVAITDVLELRAVDDAILGATVELGSSAAATQEKLIRDALLVNTNVLYCDNITLATGAVASTPTSPAAMEASATVLSKLTPDSVNRAATILRKSKAPTIDGRYVAVIHPSVEYDLRASEEWIDVHKYASVREIFNGEIGELHGVRFLRSADAPVLDGEYANKAGGVTYATYIFGKDAFGIIDPEGGGLEMIIKDKSNVGGPLDQFSTVGYKFSTNGATILYPERMVRVMSCSTYSATDEAN